MRIWLRYFFRLGLGGAALATLGCRQPTADTFLLFETDYSSALFAWSPTLGTLSGFHDYDRRLENWSTAAHSNRIAELRAFQKRLAVLGPHDRTLDAELLASQLKAELFDLATLETWRHNPMSYIAKPGEAIDVLMKRDFAPVTQRIEAATARLKQVPALLDAMRNNVQKPAREFTELALQMAKGSVDFFRQTVPEWAEANDHAGERLNALRVAARNAADAMQAATEWLEKDLLPRSAGSYAIGTTAFSQKLLYEEMVAIPLPRLLAMGEENLRKDQTAFRRVAQRLARDPRQAMALLADDHPLEEDLVPATQATIEKIRQFLVDRQIVTLPNDRRPTVAATPPFARNGAFASMDSPGAFEEKATEAFYYVTPPDDSWTAQHKTEHMRLFNRPVLEIITLHEAFPGHFVQFLYGPTWPSKTRKLFGPATNIEGWAHYVEQMMLEEGYGAGDPRLQLAQLAEALLRDCRYIVGIKLHTQGMTVAEGARFFVEQGYQEPANAWEEARRGTYNPTYLYYTLGKLLLYELRADYQRKLGAAYSLRRFHDAFLKEGPLPFALLKRALR